MEIIRYFILGLLGTANLVLLVILILWAKNKPREFLDITLGICIICIFFAIICGIGYGISLLFKLFH